MIQIHKDKRMKKKTYWSVCIQCRSIKINNVVISKYLVDFLCVGIT